jgi:GNAT superfamily N-acetyltransferase
MTKQRANAINALLVVRVASFLEPYLESLSDHSIETDGNTIEVLGQEDSTPTSLFILIQLKINEEFKQVFIPKIFLPPTLRHQGIGKRLIKVVYDAATQSGYELFIALMTESFYARMIRRGALPCEQPDMVQIVSSTRLD